MNEGPEVLGTIQVNEIVASDSTEAALVLNNIPFTPPNMSEGAEGSIGTVKVSGSGSDGIDLDDSAVSPFCRVATASTALYFRINKDDTSTGSIIAEQSGHVEFQITYFTAS